MEYALLITSSLGGIFFLILMFLILGYWWKKQQKLMNPQADPDTRIVDGAIFTVMGLLVAFTFYGANYRLDARRNLIIQEAKAILNTYYYFDTLPAELRKEAKRDLNDYIHERLKWSHMHLDKKALEEQRQKVIELQKKMWKEVIDNCSFYSPGKQNPCSYVPGILIRMFELEEESVLNKHLHPPFFIYLMLLCIVLVGAVLAGYNIKGEVQEVGTHMFAFAIIMSLMLFVILNLEFPRIGIFNTMVFENLDTAFKDIQTRIAQSLEKSL